MDQIIHITQLDQPELDVYARLTQAQLKNRRNPEEGLFIAESPNVIAQALKAGCVPVSLLMEEKHIQGKAADIIAQCGPDVPVYTAPRDVLAGLTGFELTRGILCALRRPAPKEVATICQGASRVAVLDGIVDATNLGAIVRSAAALHMDAVLLTPTCCDPLSRRAVRVSMGTLFQIPWAVLERDWQNQLRDLGLATAAMALDERAVEIDHPDLMAEERLAIVLGTEGHGLSQEVIEGCDYTVCIPMSHQVDSLNVAAASAVAFWQLGRR